MPARGLAAARVFSSRHELLFAMPGATIILLAFVLREGFMGSAKGLDSGLSQAGFEPDLLAPLARIEAAAAWLLRAFRSRACPSL